MVRPARLVSKVLSQHLTGRCEFPNPIGTDWVTPAANPINGNSPGCLGDQSPLRKWGCPFHMPGARLRPCPPIIGQGFQELIIEKSDQQWTNNPSGTVEKTEWDPKHKKKIPPGAYLF
jgi:hypothetical protein